MQHYDENYTGFRFLVDAQSNRQYAVQFLDGNVVPPLRVFGEKLKPNETVFALDDDQINSVGAGKRLITTGAYQITAGATGKPHLVDAVDVTYQLIPTAGAHFCLGVTPESRLDLRDAGFKSGFPTHFDRAETTVCGAYTVSLPPHHKGGKADVARKAVAGLQEAERQPSIEARVTQLETTVSALTTKPSGLYQARKAGKGRLAL